MRLRLLGIALGFMLGATCACLDERVGGATMNAKQESAAGVARAGSEGYVLFSPLLSYTTYLIDMAGRVIRTWESDLAPGVSSYLLDNGNLLRCGRHPKATIFHSGGQGGRIQEFSWDGKLLWDWAIASKRMLQHHDIEPLPNGNVLAIAWELKTAEEAIRPGWTPADSGRTPSSRSSPGARTAGRLSGNGMSGTT